MGVSRARHPIDSFNQMLLSTSQQLYEIGQQHVSRSITQRPPSYYIHSSANSVYVGVCVYSNFLVTCGVELQSSGDPSCWKMYTVASIIANVPAVHADVCRPLLDILRSITILIPYSRDQDVHNELLHCSTLKLKFFFYITPGWCYATESKVHPV